MSDAGWDQLVVSLMTVFGTLGGVGLGGWLNMRGQRAHWRREREERARDVRRSTYAEFALVAADCRRLLQQLFYFQQVNRDAEILATGEEYNRRNRDLHTAAAQVALIAPPELAGAAQDVIDRCGDFINAIRDVEPVPNGSHARTESTELEELRNAVNAFVALARTDTLP
jgi:hypothetical protein